MKRSTRLKTVFTIICLSLIYLPGCACIDIFKPSVNQIRSDNVRYEKIINHNKLYCYEKSIEALQKWGATVIDEKDKKYIIAVNFQGVFKSCINTTQLGIYFYKKRGKDITKVKVASYNDYLAKYISEKLFAYLESPETDKKKTE